MRILALQTLSFRNLEHVMLEAHPRFNVLHGDNGQGKTNLLEAIYLAGTLRSFRAAKLEELVGFGATEARVRARIDKDGERVLEVKVTPGHKAARIDGKAARPNDYFGSMNVVLFQPDDLRLPRGAPSGRRRFVDRAIFSERPSYLTEAQAYERVLRSRNALLRGGSPIQPELLEVYDEQLAKAAVPIVERRRAMVAALGPRAQDVFRRLTRTGRVLEVGYRDAVAERGEGTVYGRLEGRALEEAMRSLLVADRRRDQSRGSTSAGPHTDDLTLHLDGKDVQKYASQGQLRAIVLALKIGEIEHLTERLGDAPILLLDDVSSELDATRNAQLFEFLDGRAGQVFITTTDPRHVRTTGERKDVRIAGGHAFAS